MPTIPPKEERPDQHPCTYPRKRHNENHPDPTMAVSHQNSFAIYAPAPPRISLPYPLYLIPVMPRNVARSNASDELQVPHPIGNFCQNMLRTNRTFQHGRVSYIKEKIMFLNQFSRPTCFLFAPFTQVDIRPPGKPVFLVPNTLPCRTNINLYITFLLINC